MAPDLNVTAMPNVDAAAKERIAEAVRARLAGLPGVRSAALVSNVLPLGSDVLAVAGRAFNVRTATHDVASQAVSPEYFQTAEVPLLAGRGFTAADAEDTIPVAIVNARLAQMYFPDGNAEGRQIKLGSPEDKSAQWLTIAGVAGNVKTATVFQEMGYVTKPVVYQPIARRQGSSGGCSCARQPNRWEWPKRCSRR